MRARWANQSTTSLTYSAASIPGRILPPHLGDRIGHFNVLTVSGLMTGVSILALWLPFNYHTSQAGIIVFALVYGFVSGAFVCLLMPCVAKSGSLDTLGQRFGTFQTVIAVRSVAVSVPFLLPGPFVIKNHPSPLWNADTLIRRTAP